MGGKTIGQYEILGPLGAGGMGEVFRARDTVLEREVALKFLPTDLASDPLYVARLKREARLLAALNHPKVATIHAFEQSGDTPYLVLELVEGRTLAQQLADGPLPETEAIGVARQVAEALEAAHAEGIIHRDLKPSNVMLRDDGSVKVLDFGIARSVDPFLSRNGTILSLES